MAEEKLNPPPVDNRLVLKGEDGIPRAHGCYDSLVRLRREIGGTIYRNRKRPRKRVKS